MVKYSLQITIMQCTYYIFNVLTVTTVKYTVQVIHKCCVSVTYFLGWIACVCFFEMLQSFNYNPHGKVILYLFLCKLSSHYVRLPDCQSGLVLILLWLSIGLPLEAWVANNIFSELNFFLFNPVRQISTHLFRFYLFKPVFFLYVFCTHSFK